MNVGKEKEKHKLRKIVIVCLFILVLRYDCNMEKNV